MINIEISSRCQASCPMCRRNIHGSSLHPSLVLSDWSLEDFKSIINEEVLNQINSFSFCGNTGDPAINKNLVDMCQHITDTNRNVIVSISTNGSLQKEEWWKQLARALPPVHTVLFGIDGLEDTHHLYRIGTDYNKIIDNAKAFISAGGSAIWQFIKFKHNEHQVEEAQQRAKELGFNNFILKESSRFDSSEKFKVVDDNGDVSYYLEAASDSDLYYLTEDMVQNYKHYAQIADIRCSAKEMKQINIDSEKKIRPCCFFDGLNPITENEYIHSELRQVSDQQNLDLIGSLGVTDCSKKSIRDIIDGDSWQIDWAKHWCGDNKLLTCVRNCGQWKKEDVPKKLAQCFYNEVISVDSFI